MVQLDLSTARRARELVRARINRRGVRDERGSMLVEALIGMAIVSIVVVGFLGVSTGVQASLRHHESVDIVDQYVTGLAEEASALPWGSLATCAHPTPTATSVNYATGCPARAIAYSRTYPVDGITVTVRTSIVWMTTPTPTTQDGFGRKAVIMTATWTPAGDTKVRTIVEEFHRTSTPTEAVTPGIPGATP